MNAAPSQPVPPHSGTLSRSSRSRLLGTRWSYLAWLVATLGAAPALLQAQVPDPIRVNVGGSDFTDGNGDVFAADQAYVAGGWGYAGQTQSYILTGDVSGTDDDPLYQALRGWASFDYLFDNVPVGDYEVTFYWFEPGRSFGVGARLIDVTAEGVLVLDNVDLVALTGGTYVAYSATVPVSILDGQLNLSFATDPASAVAGNVFVSGIAIVGVGSEPDIDVSPLARAFGPVVTGTTVDLGVTVTNTGSADLDVTGLATTNATFSVVSPVAPFTLAAGGPSQVVTVRFAPTSLGAQNGTLEITSNDPDEGLVAVTLTGEGVDQQPSTAIRVNAAGAAYTDSNGDTFVADQAYSVGGFGYSGTTQANVRTGDVLGTVDDDLYLPLRGWVSFSYLFDALPSDDYDITFYWYEPSRTFGVGDRLIDVSIEGVLVLDNVDIVAASGAAFTAFSQTVTASVTDGQLNVDFATDPASARAGNVFVSAIAVVQAGAAEPVANIGVSPPSLAYGTVQAGTSFDRRLSISNSGSADLDVTALGTTNAAFSVVSPAVPFTVTPGGTPAEVIVRFAPTIAQVEAGDLQITSNDPTDPVTSVAVTGEGVSQPVGTVFRINAGGVDYTDANGHVFFADQAYSAGSFGYVGSSATSYFGAVRGTTDDPLYLTVREGTSFSYQFDNLPVGDYEVRLYLNEPVIPDPFVREFDIAFEGVVVFQSLDIQLHVGSPNPRFGGGRGTLKAYSEGTNVTVVDGQLNVDFTSVRDDAILSAIAVRELPASPLASYTEVTTDVGITFVNEYNPAEARPATIGTGSAWADYDGDGDVDLFLTNHGGANALYRNDGDITLDGLPDFTDVAASAGVDDPAGMAHSAAFIDYDNDGDQDLFVTNWDGNNKLFQNQLFETGSAVFIDVTPTAGLADDGRAISQAWGDFDGDGDLDVYLTKHYRESPFLNQSDDRLFVNLGDGSFDDRTDLLCPGGVAPCPQTEGLGFTAGWFDYDNDGDVDLYLVNDDIPDANPNVLWRNDGPGGPGGWIFTDVSVTAGVDASVHGMGLGVGDMDNDGNFDVAFSNVSPNNLLRNLGDGSFEDVSAITGIQRGYVPEVDDQQGTWGTAFFDYDNDGRLDLLFVAGPLTDEWPMQPAVFFHNNGDGTFINRTTGAGLAEPGRVRNASIVDFDGDGFLDVLFAQTPDVGAGPFTSGGVPRLFHNDATILGNTNHWLTITLEGTVSNRDAIGARVTIDLPDGTTQMREITSGPTHGGGDYRAAYFGLGTNTTATVTIRWPTGVIENLGVVAADQQLSFTEPAP